MEGAYDFQLIGIFPFYFQTEYAGDTFSDTGIAIMQLTGIHHQAVLLIQQEIYFVFSFL